MHTSPSTKPPKLILFDLDNTLFSHTHSLSCALSSIQSTFPHLSTIPFPHLLTTYNTALQTVYNQYLTDQIPFSSTHALKIQLFYSALNLPSPNDEEIESFREAYKNAYRANRVATDVSHHVLKRLRDEGYKLGIVTNGQSEEQEEKARAIGVRELVDFLVASEEVGVCKPNKRIFETAVEMLGGSGYGEETGEVWMVGDDLEADVKGALGAGLKAVLYDKGGQRGRRVVDRDEVEVIGRMEELLELLFIT